MAARTFGRFYIYCFLDGHEIVYVGKGSGNRAKQQAKRFQCEHKILEWLDEEAKAYEREKYWIARLQPTTNKNAGGAGHMASPDPVPVMLRGAVTAEQWKRLNKEAERERREMERIGLRRYAARMLLRKVDETNCESVGVSKVDVFRLREVANGPWC